MPSKRELTLPFTLSRHKCPVKEGGSICGRGYSWGPSPESVPCFPQISFFSLLSVLCVMLSMAGSVLSCKNAQLARDFQECILVRFEEREPESAGWGRCAGQPGLVLIQAASPFPLPLRTERSVCAALLFLYCGPVQSQGRN